MSLASSIHYPKSPWKCSVPHTFFFVVFTHSNHAPSPTPPLLSTTDRKEFEAIADEFKTDAPDGTATAMEKGGETMLKKLVGRFGFAGSVGTLGLTKGIELTKRVGSGIQHEVQYLKSHHHSASSGVGGTSGDGGGETKTAETKSDSADIPALNVASPNDGGGESKQDAEDISAIVKEVPLQTRLAADRLAILYAIYKPICFFFDIINFYHVRFLVLD